MLANHQMKDKRKFYNETRDRKPEVRRKAATARAVRIRENIRKTLEDKKVGKSYATGQGGPGKEREATTSKKRKPKKIDMSIRCKHCFLFGHQQRKSKACGRTTYKKKGKKVRFLNVARSILT